MAETPAEKAHRDKHRDQFHEAVLAFDFWNMGGPEPLITDKDRNQGFTVGEIANSVGWLKGDMPDEIYTKLKTAAASCGLLIKDRSYASGATYLNQAYTFRKAKYAARNKP